MRYLRAPTYINADESLTIISSLLQPEFGIETKAGGSCLIAQFAFSVEALTGIDAQAIVDRVDNDVKRDVDKLGYTLTEIMEAANKPFWHKGKQISLEAKVFKYETLERLVHDVIDGTPVMLIVDSTAGQVMCNEAVQYDDGIVLAAPIRGAAGDNHWHTFLAIGVDTAGYLVVRDSRHVYSYKGYLKIALDNLDLNFHNITALSVLITEPEEVANIETEEIVTNVTS